MNPTMELVGTEVGGSSFVATVRGETVRMLVDTYTRERGELGAIIALTANAIIGLRGALSYSTR